MDEQEDEPSDERSEAVEARLRRMELMLERIEARMRRLEAVEGRAPFTRVDEPQAQVGAPPSRVPDFRPGPSASAPPPAAKKEFDIESVLGANWLAKAGMAVLVLGVVFFFRLAFDRGWIGLEAQILIGVVAGLGIAVLGDVLLVKRRYGVYPQVLSGGGAVIVYFSVYASYAFEAYREALSMRLEWAALGLALVALALLVYAVARRTPVLAAEAVALAGLAVLFGESWQPFAATYVVFAAVAALAAASWRRWEWVSIVAPVAAHATLLGIVALDVDALATGIAALLVTTAALGAAAWRAWRYTAHAGVLAGVTVMLFVAQAEPIHVLWIAAVAAAVGAAVAWWRRFPDLLTTIAAVAFFAGAASMSVPITETVWVIAYAAGMLVMLTAAAAFLREPEDPEMVWLASSAAATAAIGPWILALWAMGDLGWEEWRGWVSLAIGLAFVGLALVPLAAGHVRYGWAGAGLIVLFSWPPIHFDGTGTAIAWAALVAVAATILFLRPSPLVRIAVGVGALLVTVHLFVDEAMRLDDGVLDPWFALSPFAAATLAIGWAWIAEERSKAPATEVTSRFFLALPLLIMITYFGAALDGFMISIAWAAEAVGLVVAGFLLRIADLRIAALAVFALVLGRVFLIDLTQLDLALRIVTFLVVGALLLVASYLFARRRKEDPAAPRLTPPAP